MKAAGVRLAVPMPGHPVAPGSKAAAAALDASHELVGLIRSHDVVMVLTDTRESRWLPTLISASTATPCINVALGFDSCLVIRSGCGFPGPKSGISDSGSGSDPAEDPDRLGCYFCQDVVAPADSTQGRTLDQQCTVTRPGLAPIASALAAELAIGLLHHPMGFRAPHDDGASPGGSLPSDSGSEFGALPHCARFFLRRWQPVLGGSRAFEHCSACGAAVCRQWNEDPDHFLLRAMNDDDTSGDRRAGEGDSGAQSGFLEEASGLAQMKRDMDGKQAAARSDGTRDGASAPEMPEGGGTGSAAFRA